MVKAFWQKQERMIKSTLLCQLRSQTSPHSATMVGSEKVRFSQVATLLVLDHRIGPDSGLVEATWLPKQALARVSLPLLQENEASLPTNVYWITRKGV